VLGQLNIGVFFALLFVAAYRLPGGIAATIIAMQPLFVALLAWMLLSRKPSMVTMLAALSGIAGVALIVLEPRAALDGFLRRFGADFAATGPDMGRRFRRGGHQQVDEPLLDVDLGLCGHSLAMLLTNQVHRYLNQVADNALHIATHVTDLGVVRRLDFDEWRASEFCDAPGDLRFAHTRGTDHDDVVGHDFFAQLIVYLCTPPAIAQRDRHRFLGIALTYDVSIQFADNLCGCQLRHIRSSFSTVMCELV